jgi:hypothetical protein
MAFMLTVANKIYVLSKALVLSVVMLNVVILSVAMLNVVAPSVVMLSVVMVSVIYSGCFYEEDCK